MSNYFSQVQKNARESASSSRQVLETHTLVGESSFQGKQADPVIKSINLNVSACFHF